MVQDRRIEMSLTIKEMARRADALATLDDATNFEAAVKEWEQILREVDELSTTEIGHVIIDLWVALRHKDKVSAHKSIHILIGLEKMLGGHKCNPNEE
jgi:hypothetical protein